MTRTHHFTALVAALVLTLCAAQERSYAQEDKATLLSRLATEITNNTLLDDEMKEVVRTKLLPILDNPVLVNEIKAQNDRKVPLDTIRQVDEEWIAKKGDVPLLQKLKTNPTAMELEKILADIPRVVECFVMDNQGANVGQFNDTSDYWQGDEAKWKNSFNGGKGGIDVGKKEIDKSTTLAQQQISLPVIDTDGTIVGAITFGLTLR